MRKSSKYGINGALVGGVGNALFNAAKQLDYMEKNPGLKFSWKELLIAGAKGAAVGGAIGWGIGEIADMQNDKIRPIDTDAFLYNIIQKVKLHPTDSRYIKLNEVAEQVSKLLAEYFKAELKYAPIQKGSTIEGTALKVKFDIDIYLLFRPESFRSIAEMFQEVLEFLETLPSKVPIKYIRDQKKSIGLIVLVNGCERKIDIVPCKVTRKRGNKTSGYLYVNDKSLWSDNSTHTKTDINELSKTRLSKMQKDILIVLKTWKLKKNLPLSSHLLKHLVLDAYAYTKNRPKSITKKIIMVLRHIAKNLEVAVIRGRENTNNILTNISKEDKKIIIDACVKTIQEYEYQPNSIVHTVSR